MIEGSLSDVSLPGLLQFLATESNKSFKVSIVNGGQKGDLFVCAGEILSANYGLLEGNDALTELLFWPEGSFQATQISEAEKDHVKGNLKIPLRQVNTFADQMGYLRESQVGLNTEIVPSLSFGTQAWQEALAKQPLFKEDYAVLGWITDGRTMRQAMREFNFDVVRATSALFRLLSTGSVEVLRPTMAVNVEDGSETPISGLAAILDSMQPPEIEPEPVAVQLENESIKSDAQNEIFDASPQAQDPLKGQDQQSGLAPESFRSPENEAVDLITSLNRVQSSDYNEQSGTTTGTTLNAVSGTMETAKDASIESESGNEEADRAEISRKESGQKVSEENDSLKGKDSSNREVITSDSLPAVGSAEFNEIMAKAQHASEHPTEVDGNGAAFSQAVTTQIHLPTSFRTSSDKIAAVSSPLNPETVPISKAAALARQSLEVMLPQSAESADSVGAWAVAVRGADSKPVVNGEVKSASAVETKSMSALSDNKSISVEAPAPVPAVEESPEKRLFDIVRTDPLPIVAIDIERLFQTSFHVSPFGHISLGNDVLQADLQKILQDFKQGKNFITVATEEDMLPAQVLHYCKYCLERGFIDPPDAVVSLTADLLLGRVELEQYLLQRRRITGDELRDVIDVARQKGIKLTDLLVKLGFMTASDWDRLCQEKERFARR